MKSNKEKAFEVLKTLINLDYAIIKEHLADNVEILEASGMTYGLKERASAVQESLLI
jgi:hypothetical protein